ncbi:MAG: segregation and condensation protein A [Gammaproteobacteria bacterium SHHR-1]|uniref:segregation and condensation protein A n=1 Tax=Magnetovirga frankeli TaxID=947516 RepID=UPI001292FB85|nr:segregation and condensation protein A [gamma proteobacterium SS-5]
MSTSTHSAAPSAPSIQAKERQILAVMRQVLASVVKDTTPPHREMKHPLSDATIEDVRQCFALIAAREKELGDAAGLSSERPYFSDDVQAVRTVSIDSLKRRTN